DDGVAPVEPGRGVEQMHRPSPAPTATLDFAEHLGHDRARVDTSGQGVTMLPVSGHHRIVGLQDLHDPGRHCFLADVEMEESSDLLDLIELGASLLETPDPQHLLE